MIDTRSVIFTDIHSQQRKRAQTLCKKKIETYSGHIMIMFSEKCLDNRSACMYNCCQLYMRSNVKVCVIVSY